MQDPRAAWVSLCESGSGGERGGEIRRDAWERLESAAALIEEIIWEAVRSECDARHIETEGTWAFPEYLDEPDGTWMSAASRAVTVRAFELYLDRRVFAAVERAALLGGVAPVRVMPTYREFDFDWMRPLRQLSMWETARMRRLLEGGDGRAASIAFSNAMSLAVVATRSPTYMGRLVGDSIALGVVERVKRWIMSHGMDEATAMTFGEMMDARRAEMPPMAFTLEGERLWALIVTDEIFADLASGRFDAGSDDGLGALVEEGVEREPTVRAIEEFYSVLGAWAGLSVRERRGAAERPNDLVEAMGASAPLAARMLGTGERCVESDDQATLRLDGIRLMLALEAYRGRHGAYPAALEALVPDFIGAIPDDAFAPDGAWRHRLVDPGEEAEVEMGYVLYSVGYDGEDNGGVRASAPGLSLMRGMGGAGTDFVVNASGE